MEKKLRDLTVGAAIERAKEIIDDNRDFYTTPESEGGADEETKAAARKWEIIVDGQTVGVTFDGCDRVNIKEELCDMLGRTLGFDDQDVEYDVEQYGGTATLDDITVEKWEVK